VIIKMASAAPVSPDTPITIKVSVDGATRPFKLPLRDLGVNVQEPKVGKKNKQSACMHECI
jgi:next-to-BRCA1 protein 1